MSRRIVFFKTRLIEATVVFGEPAILTVLKEGVFAVIEGPQISYSESLSIPSFSSASGT